MKEVVIEGNIVTVKYAENAYWAIFNSPVKASEIARDLQKNVLSEETLLKSPFKFKKI